MTFQSGQLALHGIIYKPEGNGPFPAMVWNHGSEKNPGWHPDLGAFYTSRGIVLFMPHRRGQGGSPGTYVRDLIEAEPDSDRRHRLVVRLHEESLEDVESAVSYLSRLPYVDKDRIVMSGVSYGGIQTVLAAEEGLGLRAAVSFAPGSMSWEKNPYLRERLRRAVRGRRIPLFIVQAENDYSLGPSRVLGPDLNASSLPGEAKVYPAYGSTPQDGHGTFAGHGMDVWGPDVLGFLQAALK